MNEINKNELHTIFQDIKNNKENSLELLYKKYNRLVYNIAFSIAKSKENCEDIVQNVFLKIHKLEKRLLPDTKEGIWLYSLTKNETINYLKRLKPQLNIDEINEIAVEDENIINFIDLDKYNKIIAKLPKKEQEIVNLRAIGNFSFKYIAQMLNMKIPTVQWHYYKAINTLKILISNLAMFVITFTLYLKSRISIKKQNSTKENVIDNNINNNTIQEENTNKQEYVEKSENKFRDENQNKSIEENIMQDIEEETKKQENVIQDTETETIFEETPLTISRTKQIESGILFSISSIFFILTLIFLIIFTKYQQNERKKLSK